MMSRLAVHSEAAQPFNRAERQLSAAIMQKFGVSVIRTGEPHAPIDALWVRMGQCVGCSEHKVRRTSREEIRQMGDTYLITEQKLLDGAQAGSLLGVPFYVVALLMPDAMAYVWQITNAMGEPQVAWEARETKTQATCEGGEALRVNAYLPFAQAVEMPVKSSTTIFRKLV